VVLPRLKNDLVEIFMATANGTLSEIIVEEDVRVACTVMAVSGGYPGTYEKGFPITGLDVKVPGVIVFHSGTIEKDSDVVTSGGRVLCVTSFGENIDEAVHSCVEMMGLIDFDGMFYRRDIGWEFR
jgi:phosphoribosylamine--glycine ligase